MRSLKLPDVRSGPRPVASSFKHRPGHAFFYSWWPLFSTVDYKISHVQFLPVLFGLEKPS